MATILRFSMVVGIALAAVPMGLAATCCQHKEAAGTCSRCGHESGCGHHQSGCCGDNGSCQATQWADPANVHWVHKGVSFGNYMKMAKAEIPAPAPCPPSIGPIYFDFDKSRLRPESVQVCQQLVAHLKANPEQTVRVEGNCCDIGTNAYNKKLGARRAATVKKFLVENGISGKRIKTVSYGEERPKHGTDQRELNRRDDFAIQCTDSAK